jgi:hypothetical protein
MSIVFRVVTLCCVGRAQHIEGTSRPSSELKSQPCKKPSADYTSVKQLKEGKPKYSDVVYLGPGYARLVKQLIVDLSFGEGMAVRICA